MKGPNTYLTDSFVTYMDEEEKRLLKSTTYQEREICSKKQSVIKTIRNAILSSTIHSDLDNDTIVKYYKKVAANKNYESLKEHLYFSAVKNNRIESIQNIFKSSYLEATFDVEKFFSQVNDYNGVYFLPVDKLRCLQWENKLGVIIKGLEYEFESFYEDLNIPYLMVTELMEGIKKNSHIANSMIILDPYIFIDTKGKVPKIPNIIRTVKHFIPRGLTIPFALTIVTESAKDNVLFENKIRQIVDGLGGREKVNVEVFAPIKINESDRFLITNYSLIAAGHPFDRATSFSCSFLISGADENSVLKKYENWNNRLLQVKFIIDNTKGYYGNTKGCFYEGPGENKLLRNLSS